MDDELHKMSKLNEEDLEDARRKRMEEMRGNQSNRKEYLKRQHGEVHQILDEKEFFGKMKGEEKMVAAVMVTAKEYQPSVIYIDECEKVWPAKKKGGKKKGTAKKGGIKKAQKKR